MNNKRILIISNMYPTKHNKTFGIFVKNQVDALVTKGIQVDVLAIKNPKNNKLAVLYKYTKWFLESIYHLLFKGKKYDVVHAHYVFPSGLIGILFKKIFNTRLIVTAHGGDINKMARKNNYIFNKTKKILSSSDHVISVGTSLYNTIESEFNVRKEKHSIINMGVNRNIFFPIDKKEARRQLGIKQSEVTVLFVGNIIEEKGLIELIEAFAMIKRKYPNASLYIIGPTRDQNYKRRLYQMINDYRLNKNVCFLGIKDQIDVATHMAAADVFVLPSHIEGFGLVALEAMACGTPVVATGVGGLKSLLSGNAGIMVEKKNYQSLYDGIHQVLNSIQLAENIVKNGILKAEENDHDYLLKQVINIYFPPEK